MPSVLIPLAQGCEELEAVTIIDILRRGGIKVTSAGLDNQPVTASRGTVLIADCSLDDALQHSYDMIVLPGGQPGTNHLMADTRIIELIKKMSLQQKFVAAICAAPSVLASAGVLDGKNATSFPGVLTPYPQVKLQEKAVVEDGKIITSRGPGTAMDFALALVEKLAGSGKRKEVESGLQR